MGMSESGDIIRATFKLVFGAGEDDQSMVMHFLLLGGGTYDDDDIHAAIAAHYDIAFDEIVMMIPDDTDFTTIETWNVTQDRPMVEAAWPAKTSGTSTTDPLPPQVSACILGNTAVARSQGRKFLPSFTEGFSSGGRLSSTAMANIADFAAFLLAEVIGVDFFLTAGNWNPVLERFADWLGVTLSDIFKTQRRRTISRGT